MKTITQGFKIIDVPGVEKIIVKPVISYVEITFSLTDRAGWPTSLASFDLDGFRDFRDAIVRAERLATQIQNELDEGMNEE